MQDFVDWIRDFRTARGLSRPTGEMLFRYRATRSDYLGLRALFARKLEILNGRAWTFSSDAERACFVLYASEWWRREYAGGPWRWVRILESIWPIFRLDVDERTYAVERGLVEWGHQVGDAGKRYLGAIVAHGGLPLQMVAQGDGSITRLLVRGLHHAQLYGWDSARLESFFAAYEGELVQHLREKDIHRLLTSIVQTVLALRQECQLAGANNPVEILDRRQPGWRDRFPIAVDDSSAEPLLIGLVQEASREIEPVTTFPAVAKRSLNLLSDGKTYDLVMAVEMPAALRLDALAIACGTAAAAFPQAFSLELRGVARLSLGHGRLLLGGGEPTVMLSGSSKRLQGSAAVSEQLLAVRSLGVDMHEPVTIPGGETLDADLPWIFAVQEEGAVLAGAGSVRLPEDSCLVALRRGQDIQPVDASSTVVLKGSIRDIDTERWVYELKGSAAVQADEHRFLVETGQVSRLSEQWVWRGRRVAYESGPLPVYLGVPQLCKVSQHGALLPVPSGDILWAAPVAGAGRIEQPRAHRGPVDAWLIRDGVRQRRFRMALIGNEARIRFLSGESENEAAIEFHGWGLESVSGPKEVSAGTSIDSARARLEVHAKDRPPLNIEIGVTWPRSGLVQRLRLPYPSTGGRFAAQDGRELPSESSMSFRQIHGVRVQVFDRNPDAPRKYVLSVELQSSSAKVTRLRYEHGINIDRHGMGELRLLELEADLLGIFCQSDDLDARLELKLNIGIYPAARLFVDRYDAALARSGVDLSLSDACLARIDVGQLAGVSLKALPWLRADAQEVKIAQETSSGVPAGRWSTADLPMEHGLWLLYPSADSTLQLRPMLYSRSAIAVAFNRAEQLCPLAHAMSLADAAERWAAIRNVLRDMAINFEHASWHLIIAHQQFLPHLPLSTFDYWRAIARDMTASLAVVLKLSNDVPALMERMRDELGVVWELLPYACLEAGLKLHMDAWARQLKVDASNPLVRTVCEPLFRNVGQLSPVLGELVDLALFRAGFARSERLDQLIGAVGSGARPLLERLWQGEDSLLQRFLLRTHIDDQEWPAFRLCEELVKDLQHFVPAAIAAPLEGIGKNLLWMPKPTQPGPAAMDRRVDVANAPLLAGLLSQVAQSTAWWDSGERLAQLRQIRNFDPAWFELAFRAGVLVALILQTPDPAGAPRGIGVRRRVQRAH